jgi:sulfonate transport system substrate-binding protein
MRCVAAAAVAGLVLAACGSSGSGNAGGPSGSSGAAGASSASATPGTPTATAAKPATSTAGVTLDVGDQAGTGAEAELDASGLIKQLHFTIKWADFTSGPPILDAINSGSLDVGGVGDAPPVFAAASGAKIAIVGEYKNDPASAALLVPKGSSITAIKDLKGKRIAVAQGSSADYHLLTVLKAAGLTTHDVTIDYLQPAEALAALQSGQVDAWDTWSPFVEEAVAKGDQVLANGDKYGSNYSYVVAAKSALQDPAKVAAIDQYVKVLAEAHRWTATHPAQWGAIWAKSTGLPDSTMVQAAKDAANLPIPITSQTVSAEQGLVNAFSSAGLIPKSYSFAPYATTAFNDAV